MRRPILTADDYAMTDGVARSIEALAVERRLSATSVMTTMPEWPVAAQRLRGYRDRLAVGLHLNLTLAAPAGPMPRLAPDGAFPSLQSLMRAALLGHLSPDEIRQEIARQLDLFEEHFGHAPDHVDGHQHVQVLPVVRQALLAELAARYAPRPLLVRNPADAAGQLLARGFAGGKALTVKLLGMGFGRAVQARGLFVSTRFAGYSAFDTSASYEAEISGEIERQDLDACGLSIVMCHPGYADLALAAIDPVVVRRQQEHDALMRLQKLPERIWHVDRAVDGPTIDWADVQRELG